MKLPLRQIGNSRGIIIPAPVLAELKVQDEIELTVQNGRLVITPVNPIREGWFEGFARDQDADAWESLHDTPKEQEDWQW